MTESSVLLVIMSVITVAVALLQLSVVSQTKMAVIDCTFSENKASRAAYLKEHFVYIRDRINRSISYPRMARKMGWCGQVKIAFIVCEDGGVMDVRVLESSGFTILDRNAADTVKNVVPFPCPPVRAEIRMAITYRFN
jgi:TonB family protein